MSETAERTLEEPRVLVVDDQEANTKLLERMLRKAGYKEVICTTDAQWALDSFFDLDPDLILLDLHMPKLDGFAMLSALARLISPEDYVPILVLTADESLASTPARRQDGALSRPRPGSDRSRRGPVLLPERSS